MPFEAQKEVVISLAQVDNAESVDFGVAREFLNQKMYNKNNLPSSEAVPM
jgi:hypothetical protein